MAGRRLEVNILKRVIIPNLNREMFPGLNLHDEDRSIGIITADNDDAIYIGLDHATKSANVHVAYVESTYGGGSCAWSKYGGEVIGIIAGPDPEEVRSGLNAIETFVENESALYSVNSDDSVAYYSYCISRIGRYYQETYNLPEGCSVAYMASAPLESMYALDAALKYADVTLVDLWGPPTVTNCGGGLVTGTQEACEAAAAAFGDAVAELSGE